MKRYVWLVFAHLLISAASSFAQDGAAVATRHVTLREAVQLALQHNHTLRISELQIEEKKDARDAARSAYLPTVRNESKIANVTDTQFVAISAGSLGGSPANPIPGRDAILNQGGRTMTISGTQLTQPLTGYLKSKPLNAMARADLNATRERAQQARNDVALKVHQLYYQVLISQIHLTAAQARIRAAEDLRKERVQQVKYGSVRKEELVDSESQYLQAKQDHLSTELQISDFTMQLNDALGLPLTTQLVLDPAIPEMPVACGLAECTRVARESHPAILQAQQEVVKASAGIRLAKADYVPDVSAIARYDYQNNVPLLARHFGTFGIHLDYELFDGGRKKSLLRERETQLAQAKENLVRIQEEVELGIRSAYNKLERTKEMVSVSEELLALRIEASRVSAQELEKGAALRSQADSAVAQELDARVMLLHSQLDYIQAVDEMTHATGRTPQ